jgi:DNA-binding winged helix-turn-helix (wHTH) protein
MEFTFGPFTFDASSSRLMRDNAEIRLRPQALQVLRVLLQHRGRPISYEQLMAEAWQGTFVSRHTVDVTVGEVKKSLGEFGRWIVHRPKVGHSLEVPTSDELVRKGWHFASRRTKEGAERAIECFEQASMQCPTDFRAFAGSSTCYLMQATFGMRCPSEVYPKFLTAHERAVELGGLTPELRCNRAHGLHMFEHRSRDAESEFFQVLAERPAFATTHVRMALMYVTLGRLDRALEVLRQGYQADPLLPTLLPSEAIVHVWRREFDKAVAAGSKSVELHPYLQISRAAYARALEFSGRLDEALTQYQLGSVMSGDLPWMRALEGTCLVKLGRTSEAHAILDELEHRRESEYADALYMAALQDALGLRSEAFGELERAVDENSGFLYSIEVDPRFDTFRDDPRFRRVRDAAGEPMIA